MHMNMVSVKFEIIYFFLINYATNNICGTIFIIISATNALQQYLENTTGISFNTLNMNFVGIAFLEYKCMHVT